jgi:transposase-like protein
MRRPNPALDWEAIEADYRAGEYSLRELARRHGCAHSSIANRATRQGWRRGEQDGPDATPTRHLREPLPGWVQARRPEGNGQPPTGEPFV